jgi:hypothetical protein
MMRINVWAANGLLCPAIATRSIVADAFAFRPFVRTARACGQRPADDSSELHEPVDSGLPCSRELSSEALVSSCCLLRRGAYAGGRLTGNWTSTVRWVLP